MRSSQAFEPQSHPVLAAWAQEFVPENRADKRKADRQALRAPLVNQRGREAIVRLVRRVVLHGTEERQGAEEGLVGHGFFRLVWLPSWISRRRLQLSQLPTKFDKLLSPPRLTATR